MYARATINRRRAKQGAAVRPLPPREARPAPSRRQRADPHLPPRRCPRPRPAPALRCPSPRRERAGCGGGERRRAANGAERRRGGGGSEGRPAPHRAGTVARRSGGCGRPSVPERRPRRRLTHGAGSDAAHHSGRSPGRGGSLGGEEAEDEDDGERSERSRCLQRAAPGWPSRDRRGVMARYERGLPPARRRGPGDPAGRQRGADWLPASAARGGRAGPGRAGPRRPPPGSGSGAEAGAWPAGGGRRAASPARRDSAGERQAGGAAALAGDKQVGPGAEGSVPGRRSEGHGDAGDGGGSTGGLEGGDSRWFPGNYTCKLDSIKGGPPSGGGGRVPREGPGFSQLSLPESRRGRRRGVPGLICSCRRCGRPERSRVRVQTAALPSAHPSAER